MKPAVPPERTHLQVPAETGADSDERLMERFCDGDGDAFDQLFRRHARAIHRFLVRMTGDSSAADDLVQATFMSLVRARGRFRPGAAFRPWIYAIAANAARDRHRRRRKEPQADETPVDSAPASGGEPADAVLARSVQRALAQLPEKHRVAIVMHQFEGLSFSEIADALEIPVGTAKIHAHRGYEKLRDLLRDVWKDA